MSKSRKINAGERTAQRQERLQTCQALIARMWPTRRIASTLSKEWGVTERYVCEHYVDQVYKDLREDDEKYRATRRDRLREAFQDFYDKSMKAAQYAAAGQALDKIGRLDGCFIDRVEVTGAGGGAVEISVDSAVKELAAKIAAAKGG